MIKKLLILIFLVNSNNYILCNADLHHKVAIIGSGYVGLVVGAGLSEFGHHVMCVDIDAHKINNLRKGIIPIYEPELSDLILKNISENRLSFTCDINNAIQSSDIIFIAVGTPSKKDGSPDLSAVNSVIKTIANNLNGYKIICTKSTVPIGMNAIIKKLLTNFIEGKDFDIVSNPEFLREGTAVKDFFNPDRVVIGSDSQKAIDIIYDLYAPLLTKNIPFLITDINTAETIKYASNAFLAIKLSYINEIAQLCEKVGAKIEDVSRGIGLDPRIGNLFLKPGPGFGGSCLPKDASALLTKAEEVGVPLNTLKAALKTNDAQKKNIVNKIRVLLNDDVQGKIIAIWGLAFKANTDDVREAPAITIIQLLLEMGAIIKAYDPIANENMQKIIPNITYCSNKEEALIDADVLLVLTEWEEFKHIKKLRAITDVMKRPIIVDTRNILIKH